jgi:tetratricopeptide (TPR) repeat protein
MGDGDDLQAQIDRLKAKIKEDLEKEPPEVALGGAEQLKADGNALFKGGKYAEAASGATIDYGLWELHRTPEPSSSSHCKTPRGSSPPSARRTDRFTQGLQFDPTNAVLYSNRSACYSHLRQWDKALEDANRCLQYRPEWPKGHARRAAALHGYGFLEKALEAYRAAYETDPENPQYLATVEAINKDIGRRDKKEKATEFRTKAKEQYDKGDYKGAAGYYKKAIEADETDATLFMNRSLCHVHLEKYSRAVEDAERAIGLAPNLPKAWRRKAAAFHAWKKYPEAIAAYKKVMELEPSEDLRNFIVHVQNEQIARQLGAAEPKGTKRPGGGAFAYGPAKKQKDDAFDFNEKW